MKLSALWRRKPSYLAQRLIVRVCGYRFLFLSRALLTQGFASASFGLNKLDLKLLEFLGTTPGFYVELGANDGVTQSNTLLLEVEFGWSGVLIEPIEKTFKRLRHNRSQRRNTLIRAACVSTEFAEDYVDIAYANLMSAPIGLDSDVLDPVGHSRDGQQFLEPGDLPRIERVVATTLSHALREAKAPAVITLLSLDVEGAELEVLRGFEWDQEYRITWICAESRDPQRLVNFLEPKGYRLLERLTDHDFLFKLVGEGTGS